MTLQSGLPLAGLTVVEHAEGVAAQYCGRLLAVLGADVIKVERPGGCTLRSDAPLLVEHPPQGALFHYLNVNKQSVTCDLAQAQGKANFRALLGRAELLIDDSAVAARGALGLDPAELASLFPKLVYLSVLPFGAFGERADWRAEEINAFHAGGEGFLMPNGLALEMFPDRPPVKIYGHFAELVGGASALCAAMAALVAPGDIGQFVDVSVQDANLSIGCFAIQRLGEGVLETRHERSFKYGGVLECADGYVGVLTLEQHQWEGLCKLMGDPDWGRETALQDPLERGRRGKEINQHLRAWAKTQKVDDVVRKGQALGVPLAKYNEPADLMAAPQSKAREMFAEVSIAGEQAQMLVAPFRFVGHTLALKRAMPAAGADNESVWVNLLGNDRARLAQWSAAGII